MLCESSVQEVMDLTPVAHCAALEGKIPFINFFDGFRTSHEIQKIETWDYEDLKDMVSMEAIDEFRAHALNPNHPCQRGSAQNPERSVPAVRLRSVLVSVPCCSLFRWFVQMIVFLCCVIFNSSFSFRILALLYFFSISNTFVSF